MASGSGIAGGSPRSSYSDEIHENVVRIIAESLPRPDPTSINFLPVSAVEALEDREDDLTFRPTILQPQNLILLTLLYVGVGASIIVLWELSGVDRQYQISSENVHMIARYFPSIVGTATVLLFRHTVREFLRMKPYIAMADQEHLNEEGATAKRSVSGSFFPWQDVFRTPESPTSYVALVGQIVASFIVSFKVALFATPQNTGTWTLTVRTIPARVLIGGYALMAFCNIVILFGLTRWDRYGSSAWSRFRPRQKSTGLKWDPVSLADFVSLFAGVNALKCFEPLELDHERASQGAMDEQTRFRLGYWRKYCQDGPVVYGIGTVGGHHVAANDAQQRQSGPERTREATMHSKGCRCKKISEHRATCPYYPYHHTPGLARWVLAVSILLAWVTLTGAIFALQRGWPFKGFGLPYDLGITQLKLDDDDNLLVYALIFRSVPTYLAGLYVSWIIPAIDLNMRFMQPFVRMFGADPPGAADKTILSAYITASPLQVPLSAYDNGDYKVSFFSTLNTLSPLFPIFIGGLLTLSKSPTNSELVCFTFSLSAYMGVMTCLIIFSLSLPLAWPVIHRLLPRQFHSMADIMAMVHQAHLTADPDLDITWRSEQQFPEAKDISRHVITPSKRHLEARLLLRRDRYHFGIYLGLDGQYHLGFDIAKQVNVHTGRSEDTEDVRFVKPEGSRWEKYSSRGRTFTKLQNEAASKKNKTLRIEEGRTSEILTPFFTRQRQKVDRTDGRYEMPELAHTSSAPANLAGSSSPGKNGNINAMATGSAMGQADDYQMSGGIGEPREPRRRTTVDSNVGMQHHS
ncbi:hypothetical protein LTR13_003038 [Exophiala sideris]|nr:hypothetical protein LTR13_003038 [Exophiala sideris]